MNDIHNKKDVALYDLLYLINKSRKETNDTLIAKTILENRYQLDSLSLEELSQKNYISQSSLSRFIQKMGYKNYNQFKNSMLLSMYSVEKEHHSNQHLQPIDIQQSVYDEISEAIHCIYEIDMAHLMRVIETMKQYQHIVFMGSDLSMAITHILQMGLIAKGKNAYTIYDLHYQDEIIENVNEETLIICISLEERWFNRQENKEKLLNSKAYKMLWTIDEYHKDKERFNDTYLFGKSVQKNLGYNELMYFILLVYRLLLNK